MGKAGVGGKGRKLYLNNNNIQKYLINKRITHGHVIVKLLKDSVEVKIVKSSKKTNENGNKR